MVGSHWEGLTLDGESMTRLSPRTRPPASREFWKMSGSGNDFVFFDVREIQPGRLTGR